MALSPSPATAADLARESRRAARALLAHGIDKGDHVFVMLPRCPEWYAALLGCMRIWAIPMPGPNLLTAKDVAYRMTSAGAVAREIQDSVKRSTAPYKYPREIHFVDELPKTVSGKIRRTELRGWLFDGRLPAGGASGVDGTGGGGTGGGAAG